MSSKAFHFRIKGFCRCVATSIIEVVEDLIIIKENKTRIQAFKAKETYELKPVEKTLSIKVSVDEIIANLDKDSNDDEVFDHDDDNCEVLFYINEEDSDTDSEEEAYLEEVLD